MAAYTTIDYLPDLTPTEMANAGRLTFSPYTPTIAGVPWDAKAGVYGSDQNALLHHLYSFTATAGVTYDISSLSYFDPFLLRLYDNLGNTIVANDEYDDAPDFLLGGAYYGHDDIWDWVAPYTGTYYVAASWNQGSYYTFYDLAIYADYDTAPSTPPPSTGGQTLTGTDAGERITGTTGADTIIALGGADTVDGGSGNDDVNGNQGEDTVQGGAGADTVRGGQGNDTVSGGDGDDGHVNGNLGDDIVYGGAGADTLFGGQGADTLFGDAGDDQLSGDLGNDILVGGAGADRFMLRTGGGVDFVTDFKASEGDRIVVQSGTPYTVYESGGQVYVALGNGNDIIGLMGVSQAQFGLSVLVV